MTVPCVFVHDDRTVDRREIPRQFVTAGRFSLPTGGDVIEYHRIGETLDDKPVFAPFGWCLKNSIMTWFRPWQIPELDKQLAVAGMADAAATLTAKADDDAGMAGRLEVDRMGIDEPFPNDATIRFCKLAILYAVPRLM